MATQKHTDDSTIGCEDLLLRGISINLPSTPIIHDKIHKRYRFSSVIFSYDTKDKCISVYIDKEVHNHDLENQVNNTEYSGFVSITALKVRDLDLGIERAPIEGKPYHANIFDKINDRTVSQKKKICRDLAKSAEWRYNPNNLQ